MWQMARGEERHRGRGHQSHRLEHFSAVLLLLRVRGQKRRPEEDPEECRGQNGVENARGQLACK